MPMDNKTKKRKYSRKKIPKDMPKAVISYCPQICPDVMRVRLPYVESRELSGGGLSSVSGFVFRGNSLFDPSLTGIGNQPLGRDEWSNFYRRYRVLGSKLTVRYSPASSGVVMSGGVIPLNTAAVITSASQYQEQQYAKFIPLGNPNATGQGVISMYVSTDQIRGMPKGGTRVNADLSSLTSDNPINQWYWHIAAVADDGATSWSCYFVAEIEYYVELYDRETLSRS